MMGTFLMSMAVMVLGVYAPEPVELYRACVFVVHQYLVTIKAGAGEDLGLGWPQATWGPSSGPAALESPPPGDVGR